MNQSSSEALAQVLYQALGARIGLLVRVQGGSAVQGRQALYRARASLGDPALEILQIRASGIEGGDLIIVRGSQGSPVSAGVGIEEGL